MVTDKQLTEKQMRPSANNPKTHNVSEIIISAAFIWFLLRRIRATNIIIFGLV